MSLEYSIEIVGACETGLGNVIITPTSGNPPYTFSYSNGLGVDYNVNQSEKYNLLPGPYSVEITDSTAPLNNQTQIVNFYISSGNHIGIVSVSGSTCSENNGYVMVAADSPTGINTFYLYDSDDNLISVDTVNNGTYYYSTLSGGVYNIVVDDNAGCTAQTGNFLITSGTPLDFGFYVVNDGLCNGTRQVYVSGTTGVTVTEEIHTGKLFITGLTGNPPFTYLWSDGSTGTTITGLTSGTYSCRVTSNDGCVVTKSATVENFDPLGLGSWVVTQPTCFNSDGVITLTITGGTGPYYYSASTGQIAVSYSQSISFSGLPGGNFSVDVTDASLCKNTFNTQLITPGTFLVVDILTQNSTCNSLDGKITIKLRGGSPAYTYTLVSPSSNIETVTTNSTTQIFENLSTGEYTLIISDNGDCIYQQIIPIITDNKFNVNVTPTNGVCGLPQGYADISISGSASYPVNYVLSNGYSYLGTYSSGVTFNDLESGSYDITITDSDGCSVNKQFQITMGEILDFNLYSTECGTGDQGTITAYITKGLPPFELYWSENVTNQTGTTVTGLTAGTYSLTVTDGNGCDLTKFVNVTCFQYVSSYKKYSLLSKEFDYNLGTQITLQKLLNEGWNDVTSSNNGCVLNNSVFSVSIDVEGFNQLANGDITSVPYSYYNYCQTLITGDTLPSNPTVCYNQYLGNSGLTQNFSPCYVFEQSFYTGYTRTDAPSAQIYYNVVQQLLETIPGVTSVNIDFNTGQTKITTEECLSGKNISINLTINYDVSCES
jgi:hypothetical protein